MLRTLVSHRLSQWRKTQSLPRHPSQHICRCLFQKFYMFQEALPWAKTNNPLRSLDFQAFAMQGSHDLRAYCGKCCIYILCLLCESNWHLCRRARFGIFSYFVYLGGSFSNFVYLPEKRSDFLNCVSYTIGRKTLLSTIITANFAQKSQKYWLSGEKWCFALCKSSFLVF